MNDTPEPLGVGLHVCKSVERDKSGNLVGVDCDKDVYDELPTLYAAVVGRSQTVGKREIRFFLNGTIVDMADGGNDFFIIYYHPLDERFVGRFRIEYVENSIVYWAREFDKGVCPVQIAREIPIAHLIDVMRKFQT